MTVRDHIQGTDRQEIITSWVALGSLGGALIAGWLSDELGRRFALILAAGIFPACVLVESLAPATAVMIAGRLLLLGARMGVASVAAPLYGAEHAPARDRGRIGVAVSDGPHNRDLRGLGR